MSRVARAVSLFKHHQISSNTALNSVFGEDGYLADEAEMGLIRLIPVAGDRCAQLNKVRHVALN